MDILNIGLTLFIVFALLFSIFFIWRTLQQRRRVNVAKITMRDIERMAGLEFEDYLAAVFAAIGYETYRTTKSGDFGADLLVIDKEGKRIVIQAKRYDTKLGLSCVQEVYTAKAYYDADETMVVTSANEVTAACWQLAAKTGTSFLLKEDLEELSYLLRKGQLGEARELVCTPQYAEKKPGSPRLEAVSGERRRIEVGAYHYTRK
ncbi:restriction endonuclease [Shouchella lonarensis]|uniref:Endonuclease, HJR/Mrr/RecB family n=1 Tax=Shouchella lonarensis TaxID=1464122 RepID=A0A1G6MFP0_9BACI|nr:restriction endonuclease [Shouchella lonarensis]SDC54333.1 Endonuclease, HJR/Mrr/RecB family [Shouchella lonarensis]